MRRCREEAGLSTFAVPWRACGLSVGVNGEEARSPGSILGYFHPLAFTPSGSYDPLRHSTVAAKAEKMKLRTSICCRFGHVFCHQ